MTKKEFNESVDDIIARCILKAYAAQQEIEELEPMPADDTIFVDDEYEDDLRDRYNEVKFWK